MPMINQTPDSQFASLLKPFFDSIGQTRSPQAAPSAFPARQMTLTFLTRSSRERGCPPSAISGSQVSLHSVQC